MIEAQFQILKVSEVDSWRLFGDPHLGRRQEKEATENRSGLITEPLVRS